MMEFSSLAIFGILLHTKREDLRSVHVATTPRSQVTPEPEIVPTWIVPGHSGSFAPVAFPYCLKSEPPDIVALRNKNHHKKHISSMKATLKDLPTGSLGITFTGTPATIKAFYENSKLASVVEPGMIVTKVVIPHVVEIQGGQISTSALVRLLKSSADTEGRSLTFQEDNEYGDSDTVYKVTLSTSTSSLVFSSHGKVPCLAEESAKALYAEAGLPIVSLSIPNVGEFENPTTEQLSKLLKLPTEGRILTLRSKRSTPYSDGYYDFMTSCQIQGHDAQVATVQMEPGQSLIAKRGVMIYMSEGMEYEIENRDKVAGMKVANQRGFVLTKYTFQSTFSKKTGTIALASSNKGQLFGIHLEEYGGRIIGEENAFVFGNADIKLYPYGPPNLRGITGRTGSDPGRASGEGRVMQRIEGSGMVFLGADGVLLQKELQQGEKIFVTTGGVVAYQYGVEFGVERIKKFKNVRYTGEGYYVSTLTGPGTVWLETHDSSGGRGIFDV